ncbi:baseplate multidomain protein megatron [Brevundimonas sp. SL130]|uniref:baseplate multidomain protein megatron n=1 Tax=Brevundimonas sp. SL130 TaxID=2995143 RepID=UPI00226CA528|nr:glycoside hydrolase/phage tail family protein [Brevundimonas sp. SL130]WAC59414.1 glycoside hydrolase/phage tail family protein [Brevundimonas sp. SL130]
MAQVVLSAVGQSVGGAVGRVIGATIGRAIDNRVVGSLSPARQVGPRLDALNVQGTAEGSPMACVLGRARVTGQVIWAARFLESRNKGQAGKGGPTTVDYVYSLSFAVALCEGEIDGIGRVWADGRLMDLSGVAMRVYRGGEDQTPDPLIEAVEGNAPAYRGTAYVVFEDLPLGPFGDRVPQLSFEVFRRPRGREARLEDLLEGVCLIPGAGEFALATQAVVRREGLTRTTVENVHNGEGRADLVVSLDQLQAQLPNLRRVSLVVGWFGDDLRAGHCRVRPGVERRDKPTEPLVWSVAGVRREEAYEVTRVDGAPAYGGTPSDESVRQAIAELKARGLEVTLYPFVFMDCPGYPWRGRVAGVDGAGATAEIAALFGGAEDWGLRRMALHYARIAAEEGAGGLLIGSEMRGVTWTRGAAGSFPAVAQFRALAAECRAVAGPEVQLSYAADWSEYFGRQTGGEVVFHLDPLWADPNIDHVSIDWYPPLTDWREGDGGVDAAVFDGAADPAYLAAGVAGGDGFDWYYANEVDRAAQVRTPIVDTAHGEDWVFRPKDLKSWWSSLHYDRPGGVRRATPTAWLPGMKPVRLSEFGCAAVNRGGNAPNLFQDPKSRESSLPPGSTGVRDDAVQRAALEAVLGHYGRPENNPVSAVYGGRMLEGADAWCWDARPYPAFPARGDVWADAQAWRAGHWLNGRLAGDGRDLIEAVLTRGGLAVDEMSVEGVEGAAAGYVIDRPMRTRDALEPLLAAFDAVASERNGRVAVLGRTPICADLAREALALADQGAAETVTRGLEMRPGEARVRFIDETADYQTGAVTVRAEDADTAATGGGVDMDLPLACGDGLARAAAERALDAARAETVTLALGPLEALQFEPGDVLQLEGRGGDWRVMRVMADETPSAVLEPVGGRRTYEDQVGVGGGETPSLVGAPFALVMDLPPLMGGEEDRRPVVAAAAEPWRAMRLYAGASVETLTARADMEAPATVGVLMDELGAGVRHRWDEVSAIVVRIEGASPQSAVEAAVLGGANALAVETAAGWEVVQYRSAVLVGPETWRLTGLLRGQQGTEVEMRAGARAGSIVVFLDDRPARAEIGRNERGLPLVCRVGPAGSAPGGAGFSEVGFTLQGLYARPWSPAGLAVEGGSDGLTVRWTPRVRLYGDGWDGEPTAVDPLRFRVRVIDGEATVVRTMEVGGTTVLYSALDLEADFPGGASPMARIGVSQWGDGFGWGVEAEIGLV